MQTPPITTLDDAPEEESAPLDAEVDVRALVQRLSRPHPSGGSVIERAAIMASGSDSRAVLDWIADHGGRPEDLAPRGGGGGGLFADRGGPDTRKPLRYVLPPDAG